MQLVELLERLNPETEVILALSIILFAGFIMTRLTNTLNMPKVSGYILAGILIGPYCMNFIPGHIIEDMGFISDVALAFIAFGVGKFFKKEVLMRTGKRIIVITVSEAMMAGVLVTLILKAVFRLDWGFALILGAIATATAPASTMMTINQYKAKGEFVNTLLQIVALDDVVCLLAFSIVSAVINGLDSGSLSANDILIPVFYNILTIGLGVFCGYFLSRLLIPTRSRDNRLILAIAMLMGLTGICSVMDISPLLSCMVFGAVYINLTRDKKLFRQINNFTPPVMSMFFVVSGMNLDISALSSVGAIGVSYFVIRIVGKYLGTYLSCMAMKTSREIRNYMGFALIPQAGVAIGLAFLGQRILPEATGNLMLTIILASSVLYEMVGPVSAKAALFLSGSIPGGGGHVQPAVVETEDGRLKETEPEEDGAEESEEEASAEDVLSEEKDDGGAGIETGDALTGRSETAGDGEEESSLADDGEPEEAAEELRESRTEEPDEGESEEPDEWPERSAGIASETAGDSQGPAEAGETLRDVKSAEQSGSAESLCVQAAVPEDGNADKKKSKSEKTDADGAKKGRPHGGRKKAPKLRKPAADPEEELTTGLPELHEYNKGVDERDDYDAEKVTKPLKAKKKKKKK